MNDPVEHIELRNWADICIVAPLSAHTLAKFAHGYCDDTLSCTVRAWDYGHYVKIDSRRDDNLRNTGKPLILVPAMNTAMWEHPLTAQQLNQIESFGIHPNGQKSGTCIHVIPPQVKMLACGEMGVGAMADVSTIVEMVYDILESSG
jgi:phosphopantothenoylcysteine decarboxylase